MISPAMKKLAAAADFYQDLPQNQWPEPDLRLITDDRPPAPRLNDDALPAGWTSWIAGQAEARACPPDYVAAATIGAASAWIGNARRIMPTSDWSAPSHLWFALVGAPSTGKTPALAPMIEASRTLERDAEPAWRDARTRQEQEGSGDAPPRPRVIAMDTSTDELQHMLSRNRRGLLFVRDELAGWIGSFDRYNGKGADRAFFNECWNGDAYVADRVKYRDEPVRIEHASLAIVGAIVPDRLREVLADADDGLAARFIYVSPEPMPIAPLINRGDDDAGQRRAKIISTARRLRALDMGADQHNTPAPRALQLSLGAYDLYDTLRRAAMQRARDLNGLAAGWHGKNPGRILRVALTYELLAWAAHGDANAEPTVVSVDAVARAGRYLDYAAVMLDRIAAGLAIGPDDAHAAAVARHLLETRATTLNERDLSRMAGFSWARERERRRAALRILEADGWIRHPAPPTQAGRPRAEWDVSPRLAECAAS
jgi:uncharacterized protein DUF3987